MTLETLIDFIAEETGFDRDCINEETLMEEIVGDDFELEALVEEIENNFDLTMDTVPAIDWTVGDLTEAVNRAE